MNAVSPEKENFRAKNRIKIRRNSNNSSSTQLSNDHQALSAKYSIPIQSIPNEQQLEDDGLAINDFRRNEEETFSIKSGGITSMDKIKVTRT